MGRRDESLYGRHEKLMTREDYNAAIHLIKAGIHGL